MKTIDFHTHAFPDFLAERAVAAIEAGSVGQHPRLDGTVADLLRSMDRAGVEASVIASIATADKQVPNILKWSREIASDRIVPFPSVWPHSADAPAQVRRIADAGLKGVKLHPHYQGFEPLDERMMPIYQAIADAGLIALFHSGDDLAFPGDRRCLPSVMLRIHESVPSLTMVLAHLGGFRQAEDFARSGIGSDAFIEVSLMIPEEPGEEAFDRIIRGHAGRVMFGTDSPWSDQAEEIEKLTARIADPKLLEDILWNTAAKLLGMGGG